MNKSDSIVKLAGALNKAQSEMGGAVKDANNPFFKSKYADLSSVVKVIKEPFANNGLSFVQFPICDGQSAGVETILMHESGEFLQSEYMLPLTKKDPQGAGSGITYAKRYALQAMAGIPSEDDDGNMASKKRAFIVDADAQSWIDAVKVDVNNLDQIIDPEYKKFIKTKAGV